MILESLCLFHLEVSHFSFSSIYSFYLFWVADLKWKKFGIKKLKNTKIDLNCDQVENAIFVYKFGKG